MTLIQHLYHGIAIEQRKTDGYINLNQMAEATGKRVQHWRDNQQTQELIAEFEGEHSRNSGYAPALITDKTNVEFGGGTWAHPDIAIQFAQWCSPSFALQVSGWVREWLIASKRPPLERLAVMSANELRLELHKAESWIRQVKIFLDTHKEKRLIEAINRDKIRQMNLLDMSDDYSDGAI